MVLNSIRNISNIIVPLITFPYLSKILGVQTMGRINFSQSVIDIFMLIAGLGISTYAVRESASLREKGKRLEQFCSQVFSINMISTLISYFLFSLFVLFIPKLKSYHVLLSILSLQILFSVLSVEWIYIANEDFIYITLRTILFRILSLLAVFLFVRSNEDGYFYAWILTLVTICTGIMNFLNSRKYCALRLTGHLNLKQHIKPIFTLFALSIAINIYVNSDITVLGFFKSDYHVGIYSFSSRIYTLLKSVLASVIAVSIPRLAAFSENKRNEFCKTAMETYSFLITFCIPSILGVITLRKEIILLLADTSYLESEFSLFALSITIFFCLGAYFWGQCIMVPNKMEAQLFQVTCFSALINLGLNLILIPWGADKAAALTTLAAEGFCFVRNRHYGKTFFHATGIRRIYWKVLLGSIPIVINGFLLRIVISDLYLFVFIYILLSSLEYLMIEYKIKNLAITESINLLKGKWNKERKNKS